MQARAIVVALMLVLVAVAVAAQEDKSVVLQGGKTLFVTQASVEGGQVYLTFANGRMQAYPVEEVDLEASGLLPEVEKAKEARKPRSMADATAKTTDQSSVKITDQDVDHVRATAPAAREDEPTRERSAAAAALVLSGLQRQLQGTVVTLSGNVENAGTKAVSAITLHAEAKDGEGNGIGSGSTTISQELPPQAKVGFSLTFPFEGRLADIQVRAVAAVAAYDFAVPAPPAAADE